MKKPPRKSHDELVSPSNRTVYLFEDGMTPEEKARGISDLSYQQRGVGTACVGNELYRIIHVTANPKPKPQEHSM